MRRPSYSLGSRPLGALVSALLLGPLAASAGCDFKPDHTLPERRDEEEGGEGEGEGSEGEGREGEGEGGEGEGEGSEGEGEGAACQPECTAGEQVCRGDGVSRCEEDLDGCVRLAAAVACAAGERCDGGECVPETGPCTDACPADGAAECVLGLGYQRCGQFDEDPCLDRSPTVPCAAGERCRDGECLPECSDECDLGPAQCRDAGRVTCGDFDGDPCLEFSALSPCLAGERCDNGQCVPDVQPCTEECDEELSRSCTLDGAGYRQCGRYDADACLELSAVVPCEPDQRCVGGACRRSCEDDCGQEARRCVSETEFSACGSFDGDPCQDWGPATSCPAAQRCDDGQCVAVEEPCLDSCPALGASRCEAGGLQSCSNSDADPCLEWSPAQPCGEGQRCDVDRCVVDCRDECQPDERGCLGQGVTRCGDFDDDACLERSAAEACPAGESCVDGECRLQCADDCAGELDRRCDPASNGYQLCGAYDADACRDWSSANPCGGNERCDGGVCVAVCLDECQLDDRRCLVDSYQVCGNHDADPCLEFGGGGPCDELQTCLNGACQVLCDHECGEAESRCSDPSGRQQCGNYDGDPCREWSAVSRCGVVEQCAAGACVPRPAPATVLINEVLYDAVGADEPAVFIELYGPPGTELAGFALVAINGNGGAPYGTIELAGSIPADGLFVVAHPQAGAALAAVADQLAALANLQNGPDSLQLKWGAQVVDALGYGTDPAAFFAGEGSPAAAVAAGRSLGRDPQHADTDDNSRDFASAEPSPGRAALCADACAADDARCSGDTVERCSAGPAGCLVWQAAEDCTAQGGQCQAQACVYPLGCALPSGVGAITTLAGMKVSSPAVQVIPHRGGFAVAVGDPSGINFGLVSADGQLTSGPTWLGGGQANGWGSTSAFFPALARTDDQFGVAWPSYAVANPNGNCPLLFRRLTLDGLPIAPANLLTLTGRSAFNPELAVHDVLGGDFLVAYNDYTVNRSLRVDPFGSPGAPVAVSRSDYDQFLRQRAFSALARAGSDWALAFTQTDVSGVTYVYFVRLDSDGVPLSAEVRVGVANVWTSARNVFLFRIATNPERFGLFYAATAGDANGTSEIQYAVLDGQGAVQSRVRLNDLHPPSPNVYVPQLTLRHVLFDGERFGVVHRRAFELLESEHYLVQWLSLDGRSQGRTELGANDGVLARLPEDGLYRLFITRDATADLRVAPLTCP